MLEYLHNFQIMKGWVLHVRSVHPDNWNARHLEDRIAYVTKRGMAVSKREKVQLNNAITKLALRFPEDYKVYMTKQRLLGNL